MNKAEMIDYLAKSANINKTEAGKALDSLVGMVTSEIKAGRSFRLAGLGTFSLKERAARTGRNPQTGEAIKIPKKKGMAFKQAVSVGDLLNPSKK
jgi:DNA-binding protein HU-beta